MKKNIIKLMLVVVSFAFINSTFAQKVVKKSFSAKEALKINLVSGDCKIKKSESNKFDIELSYTYPDDCFEFKFEESDDALEVKEKFDGNCRGESKWVITIPEDTKVKFNSASGDLVLSGIKNDVSSNTASGDIKIGNVSGAIKINTASGDIDAMNISGELKLNTASGDIKIEKSSSSTSISTASGDVTITGSSKDIKLSTASGDIKLQKIMGVNKVSSASGEVNIFDSKGAFTIGTASGDIEALNMEFTAASKIGAASGDVLIKLAKSLEHDMTLGTASGDIDLDYNGNTVKGFFEFTARKDKGKIVSPFKFDKEEVIEKNGKKYDKKSFTKGGASPKVYLKTSSGTITLGK